MNIAGATTPGLRAALPPLDGGDFERYVNPHLGRALAQLALNKEFVRGEGCYLYDCDGHRYLDFLAQYGALPFGFNPPEIWASLLQARERLEPSFVQPSLMGPAAQLARRLLALAPPGLRYVTFANSGAEAVEAAIKMCRSTTGRLPVLATTNGFHGKTLGALSATGNSKYQAGFGAPVAGFEHVAYGHTAELREALATGRYAAFLVEPIQGEGGIVEPPPGYLEEAQALCRETGTLFVADEIQTGLGRTGTIFACGELGLRPDLLLVAKALSGGLIPIGACLASERAYNREFALKHTSTYAGNALACRAALATLDRLEDAGQALVREVAATGARLKQGMLALRDAYPDVVRSVRGRGYMLGMSFGSCQDGADAGLLARLADTEILTALAMSHLLNHERVRVGYTLNDGGVLRIEPPLTATWEECARFLAALERVAARLREGDTARFTSHLTGLVAPPRAAAKHLRAVTAARAVRRPEARFAFLVHPLTLASYTEVDPSLTVLDGEQLERLTSSLADNFDPFVLGDSTVRSAGGAAAFGEFVLVPRTAEGMVRMACADAIGEVHAAATLAARRGARVIGLGAYTSVVTRGGLCLTGNGLPALTTGNTFTAYSGCTAVATALGRLGRSLDSQAVAVVGATGAIGRAIATAMASKAASLCLLGNPEHRTESRRLLVALVARILRQLWAARGQAAAPPPGTLGHRLLEQMRHEGRPNPDPDALAAATVEAGEPIAVGFDLDRWLPRCDAVVTTTSSTRQLITPKHLKPGAVLCDISRPSNVSAAVRRRRPDVWCIEGGVVRLPEGTELGFNAGLAPGQAYACMAETMLLALERRYQDQGLGFDLEPAAMERMGRLADRHGFDIVLSDPPRRGEPAAPACAAQA